MDLSGQQEEGALPMTFVSKFPIGIAVVASAEVTADVDRQAGAAINAIAECGCRIAESLVGYRYSVISFL
jgi:hypothetical protein